MRRGEGKALREVIESIAFERDLRWAFANNFLVKPHGLTVKIPHLDLNKVKTTAGDFNDDALAEVMEAASDEVIRVILKYAAGRRPIIFAPSVHAADMWAQLLTEAGFATETLVGVTKGRERDAITERFRSGETRAVTTVAVLTEGADFPWCDCVIIGRPTKSQNLYVQMTGRCERLSPETGKTDALVLDLVGTTRVMKLVTLSSLDAGTSEKIIDETGEEETDDEPQPVPVPQPKPVRLGSLSMIEIDLLGDKGTDVRWAATDDGVPFFRVPASARSKDVVVFLWPLLDGTYQPGWVYMNTSGGSWITPRSLELEAARDLACDFATERGVSLPSRHDGWYRSPKPPSQAQLDFATRLGIVADEKATKGTLSDKLDIAQVTKRLRPNTDPTRKG
jgi:hypothetical protein